MKTPSGWTLLASGVYACACAPAVLLAERFGWPQAPLHLTQLLAALLCLVSSLRFVWTTRGRDLGWQRSLAVVAGLLSGSWVAFVGFVLVTLDFDALG